MTIEQHIKESRHVDTGSLEGVDLSELDTRTILNQIAEEYGYDDSRMPADVRILRNQLAEVDYLKQSLTARNSDEKIMRAKEELYGGRDWTYHRPHK